MRNQITPSNQHVAYWLTRVYNADGSHAASCQNKFAATLQVFPSNLPVPRTTITRVTIPWHRLGASAASAARRRMERWHHSHQYYNNNCIIMTESRGAWKDANNESTDKTRLLKKRNRRYLSFGDERRNAPSTTNTSFGSKWKFTIDCISGSFVGSS